jgi:hypothetical protein
MPLENALVVAALAAATAVALAWTWRWTRRRRETVWRRFARRHGLRVVRREGHTALVGNRHGRSVRLAVDEDGSDGELVGIVPVRMEVQLRLNVPPQLALTCSGAAIGALAQGLGAQTLPADERGGGHLILQEGADAESAGAFLTLPRRQALLQLARDVDPATAGLERQCVYCEDRMTGVDLDRLDAWLQKLEQAAAALDLPGDEIGDEQRDREPERGADAGTRT